VPVAVALDDAFYFVEKAGRALEIIFDIESFFS
jgi:hypothetical protein